MLALAKVIGPCTRSSKVVSPSGTRNRIARGVPAASSAAISAAVRLRQCGLHQPPPASSVPDACLSVSAGIAVYRVRPNERVGHARYSRAAATGRRSVRPPRPDLHPNEPEPASPLHAGDHLQEDRSASVSSSAARTNRVAPAKSHCYAVRRLQADPRSCRRVDRTRTRALVVTLLDCFRGLLFSGDSRFRSRTGEG